MHRIGYIFYKEIDVFGYFRLCQQNLIVSFMIRHTLKKGYSYMYKTHTCAQLQTIPNYGIIKKCPFSFLMSMNLGVFSFIKQGFFSSFKHLANIDNCNLPSISRSEVFHLWDTRWRPRTPEASLRSTWTATPWTP